MSTESIDLAPNDEDAVEMKIRLPREAAAAAAAHDLEGFVARLFATLPSGRPVLAKVLNQDEGADLVLRYSSEIGPASQVAYLSSVSVSRDRLMGFLDTPGSGRYAVTFQVLPEGLVPVVAETPEESAKRRIREKFSSRQHPEKLATEVLSELRKQDSAHDGKPTAPVETEETNRRREEFRRVVGLE